MFFPLGPSSGFDRAARWVLNELLAEPPQRHWSLRELERALDFHREQVEDAVAHLHRSGLAHRNGEFVFATVAAIEGDRLMQMPEDPFGSP